MVEIWKEYPNNKDYLVSSLGKVKSKIKIIYDSIGRKYTKKSTILKPIKDKNGYLYVNLYYNRVRKKEKIHRLVAYTFLPTIEGLNVVNHKDLNKENNLLENLEWSSPKLNVKHAIENKKFKCRGEENPNSKLTIKQVDELRKFYEKYSHRGVLSTLAKKYNVSITTICYIIKNKNWK